MERKVGEFLINETLTKALYRADWVIYNKAVPDPFNPASGRTTELLYACNVKTRDEIRLGWWLYDGMSIHDFVVDARCQIDMFKREHECDEETALQYN